MKNSKISDADELVESITTYSLRPIVLHGYILPFIFLYTGCLSLYLFEIVEEVEPFFIVLGVILCLQILTGLFCHWSVHVRCLLTCTQVPNTSDATLAKVVPLPNNGSPELVNLRRSPGTAGHQSIFFVFQKSKYVWDGEERKQFVALLYPDEKMLKEYMDWKGLGSEEQIKSVLDTYGDNSLVMDIPDFKDLFKERATAPFFVFQVFCVALWCLDEYWYYSLFTLFMLIVFESTLVTQQIRNLQEIRKMGNKPDHIQVYRCNRWQSVISTDLLPGDIVSVSKGNRDTIIPCDMLLLRGPAVLDESMLTGESVPQMKESLEGVDLSRPLNMASDSKLHVLFGGTKLVQHTAPIKTQAHLKSPDNGVICYVLRTSFSSSQGRLLRTILYSVSRVTANNLESFIFILFLLVFAIAAASYVWVKGCEDPERNRYKLFLECTLILTSVVPPELPIELSLAVNSSLYSLSKLFVFCTEPFRIPFAGKIDVCCFDKTGTLTSDDLVVEGIAGLDGTSKVVPANETPPLTVQVIAACHSLISVNDKVVGDPQEKAALSAIDWDLTKSSVVVPKKGKAPGMKIVQRFHFSSQLKRMSVIASYSQPGTGEYTHIAAVKGAPEVIRKMLVSVPQKYDEVYLELSRRGARVLALARKELGQSHNEIREMSRQKIECGLTFQGFIIISCPIKRDSLSVIKEIQASSHGAVMITGDNPLTACHVAKELRFTRSSKTMMILEAYEDGEIGWKSIDHSKCLPVQPEFKTSREMKRQFLNAYDFCVTGEGLTHIHQNHTEFFMKILPYVRVFARVAPKQKELVITSYKKLGMTVLMCGDGTNDVGALKHADCGVAILSNAPDRANNLMTGAREMREKQKKLTENWHSQLAEMKQRDRRDPKRSKEKLDSPQTLMKRMMDEMEEQESQMVKLGDASIAAPFTSRLSSIQCVVHIIKQGRCTLVTTLQMFKILALNALILAYAQSVLYLEGVRFSDGQATLQGLLLAGCFLFISRSKPLRVLSKERPPASIFNPYTVLTVLLQFSIHFSCLYFLVSTAYTFEPKDTKKIDLEKKFEPSILNSTVYIMSLALQICTFAINYRGHPYMASLTENSPLLIALVSTGGLVMALAMGIIPDFAEYFEIVDFPPQFRKILCQVLLADLSLCYIVDRVLKYSFGEGKLRSALRH